MDMKEILKATKRMAASLEKKLEGTGATVYVIEGETYDTYTIACPAVKVAMPNYVHYDIWGAARCAMQRARKYDWKRVDSYVASSFSVYDSYITIAVSESLIVRKAAEAIFEATYKGGWQAISDVSTAYGSIAKGHAAIKAVYGTSDLHSVAAKYIARLEAAETIEDIDVIKAATIDEIESRNNAARTIFAATVEPVASTAAPEAVEPVAVEPAAVEVAETAKYTLDNGVEYMYRARVRGVEVGNASVIVYDDGDAYVERIDVDDGYRNRGYGTAMLKQLAAMYGDVYLAPDNDDARRLYARLGDDVTGKGSWGYVDQGYGVYAIAA